VLDRGQVKVCGGARSVIAGYRRSVQPVSSVLPGGR